MEDTEKKKLEESLLYVQAEMKAIFQGFQDILFKLKEDGHQFNNEVQRLR